MANLLVEIGNTALKASISEGFTLGKTFRYQGLKNIDFILSLIEKEKPSITIIASVFDIPFSDFEKVTRVCSNSYLIDNTHRELVRNYGFPDYLSVDRIAGMIAANYLFKDKSCTIVDFGNTITIDYLGKNCCYDGGIISPGCRTRLNALHRYSKSLPLVNMPQEIAFEGHSLKSSIESGTVLGIMFEIQGYINHFQDNIVIFTGGDAKYFAKRMKNSIFVVCNLVLMGLSIIIDQNVQKISQ